MEYIKSETCCVLGHTYSIKEAEYRAFLKSELELLIQEGYKKFITYYEPKFNHTVVEILNDIKRNSIDVIYIEFILISFSKLKWATRKEQKEFDSLTKLCDEVTILDSKHTPETIPFFCNYLVSNCDFLFCFEQDFRLIHGKTNAKVVKAFRNNDCPMKIIHTSLIYYSKYY